MYFMFDRYIIERLLPKLNLDIDNNVTKILSYYKTLQYSDKDDQSLLHVFVSNKFDERKCYLAIQALLNAGINPNLEDCYGKNFIQTALYTGYSSDFIIDIINESLKYDLDINHIDEDNDNLMHVAIYSNNYTDELIDIYSFLIDKGFDSTLIDKDGKNLFDIFTLETKLSINKVKEFRDLFLKSVEDGKSVKIKKQDNDKITFEEEFILTDSEIKELEEFGNILTMKEYSTDPAVGREKELKHILISLAQDKKKPLLVGKSGVGKTSVVEELAYKISINQVPDFLKNKIILEVTPSDIVAGCKYVGQFEERMSKLKKIIKKYNLILFIDEIHTIFGIGSTENKDNDMSSMLKNYLDREKIDVIGTTTEEEYIKYFANDALKRRFNKITINEPEEDILFQIIDKVIDDYSNKNDIVFESQAIRNKIIDIIIKTTRKNNRVYTDVLNNPDLSISIIDTAFALSKIDNNKSINTNHFIEALEFCDRIYPFAKEQMKLELKKLKHNSLNNYNSKILKVDFKAKKKL